MGEFGNPTRARQQQEKISKTEEKRVKQQQATTGKVATFREKRVRMLAVRKSVRESKCVLAGG